MTRRARDLYRWTYETAFQPAWERYVRRRPTLDYLHALEQSQWLSEREIAGLQLQSLRALLQHAAGNVPYYRELFAKVGVDPRGVNSRADLAVIPVLTKDIIRERYDDLVDPAHRGRNVQKGTSGSTGVPLKFEHCMDSNTWREATKLRGYRWAGYRPGAPTVHYWGQASPPSGGRGAKIRLDRALRRDIFIDSMHSDEPSLLRAALRLRQTQPACLVVYTQSCVLWARFILEHKLRDWPDVPVICGAEAVLPGDRDILTRAFGAGIYETYGSREVMLMSSECSFHDGMHLSEENVLLEITKDGKPLEAGESGDVLVTDLHNFGFPLIRYVNGDVATMHDGAPCACGRGLRRLKRVDGRRADTLRDKEGKPIPGLVFHVLLGDARKEVVSQFQAIQRRDGSITLRVVRGPGWSADAMGQLVARMEEYLRGLPVRVEECERIAPMPNGKQRTIVVES